jgi:hypothetical protein
MKSLIYTLSLIAVCLIGMSDATKTEYSNSMTGFSDTDNISINPNLDVFEQQLKSSSFLNFVYVLDSSNDRSHQLTN